MLTKADILLILERLKEETVVEPTQSFPYKVVNPNGFGYSKDPKIGGLQAKLSLMLEAEQP